MGDVKCTFSCFYKTRASSHELSSTGIFIGVEMETSIPKILDLGCGNKNMITLLGLMEIIVLRPMLYTI
jgi:hypothetical protein